MVELNFAFPQTVDVAVSVHGNGLVIPQNKGHMGIFAWVEVFAMAAVFSFHIDPFDVVLIDHRMIDDADVDVDRSVLNGHGGQVLFGACFNRVGNQFLHGLAAANNGDAGIVDFF